MQPSNQCQQEVLTNVMMCHPVDKTVGYFPKANIDY